jgi:hypothetical protein
MAAGRRPMTPETMLLSIFTVITGASLFFLGFAFYLVWKIER